MKTALLISTYNWPEALDLVLKSAMEQTILPTELLIADDGSRKETQLLIEQFQLISKIPIRHFWQEDMGFRKSKILNKMLAQTTADYIIQVDGDCILHPHFVEDHIKNAEKGVYLYGSRVNIVEEFVEGIFKEGKINFNLFSKEIKNKTRSLHIPFFSGLYKAHKGISRKFRGCNVSFWREDFLVINGYNEDYEGWGREDSDLVIRMGNYGVKAKRLRYAGIVFHIHHKVNSKDNYELNDKMQNENIANQTVRIKNGIDQYLK
jgi:hypothetical protein